MPLHARSEQTHAKANELPQDEKPPVEQPSQAPSQSNAFKPNALTLFQANMLVAMLAGFSGRKSDGHPGAKVLGEGLIILAALVEDRRISRNQSRRPQPRGKRAREPE